MDAVQHFELPYKNRERAKKFYFQAFGWQVFDTPGSPYTFASTVEMEPNGMPKRPGAINGGLAPRTKEFVAPMVLVKVTDLAHHLKRIEQAGGTVLSQPEAMGPVWYARFRDPEGNLLGAIQNRPEGMAAAQKSVAKGGKPKRIAKAGRAAKSGKAAATKGKATKPKRKAKSPKEAKATWSR